ncbi:UDP-glucose:undecaprenyl-phosphate glucose-1-phosphate transferase [Pirellulimonas nuda]|uniref:UDP-glucose:undecaprenyl-phosphate glucose-1-phosphate transferase n=1 Tax=Pirellulimonas nuda TaxID=2528009 RepID=A0A518D7D2_9BACT|nr:sugar transferase [Pirellulimonas nuda]QDU87393.1 UDP-glucose:undecaprenyl-phosphate glucose-1-phosphate transferase [Pirellulimonas nuda]
MKRLVDITVSAVGLLALAPLLLGIAIAVRLGSRGPALFRQQRVGRHGRPFTLLKFRSMGNQPTHSGPLVTASGDPRVTPLGRLLRRTKLDELPQLWNVLVGEMSLVGPRPEVPYYVALYNADERRVLDWRPGITDPASLEFIDEERRLAGSADPERLYRDVVMPEKLRINLEYAHRATVWTDMGLIVSTLARIVPVRRGGQPASGDDPRPEPIVFRTLAAQGLFAANTLARSGSALVLMPVLIALLGPEQYALWITVGAVGMYLGLTECGLGQTVVNEVGAAFAQGDLRRVGEVQATAHVLYWMVVAPTTLAALACLYLFPVGSWLLSDADAAYRPLLIGCLAVAIPLALLRIPLLVIPGVLIGIRLMPVRLAYELAGTVLAAVAAIAVAWSGGGIIGVVIATNLALLLSTLAVYRPTIRDRPWARLRLRAFRPGLLLPLASNSGFFLLISASYVLDRTALCVLATRMDSLVLAPPLFLALNLYRVAGWSLVSAIPMGVRPYVLLWHARGDRAAVQRALSLCTKGVVAGAALIVTATLPLLDLFSRVWIGPQHALGATTFTLIAAAFLVDALMLAPASLLIAVNRHRWLACCLAGKSALTLGLALAGGWIASNQLAGLAWGMLAGTVLGNLPLPLLLCRELALPLRGVLVPLVLKPTVASAALLFNSIATMQLTSPALRGVLVGAQLLTAPVLLWTWLLSRDEQRVVRGIARGILAKVTGAPADSNPEGASARPTLRPDREAA